MARHEIPVNTTLGEEPDLPLETKETLYRIAQEALHNTVKHARASRADLKLVCDARGIALEVSDDGAGFDPGEDFSGHLDPKSMRERAWAGRSGSTVLLRGYQHPRANPIEHVTLALEGRRHPYQPAERARPVSISIRHTNLHPCSHFAAAAVGDPGVAAD